MGWRGQRGITIVFAITVKIGGGLAGKLLEFDPSLIVG